MTHVPSAAQRGIVKRLAGSGHTKERIAAILRIGRRTLRENYATELEEGMEIATEAVVQSLFEMATGKDLATGKPIPRVPAATIFWLKARAGWKEAPQDFNLNGRVVHATRADLSPYTDDELRELRRIEEQRVEREARARAIGGAVDAAFTVGDQGRTGET